MKNKLGSVRNYLLGSAVAVGSFLAPIAAHATTGDGTSAGQTYGLGSGGGPAASDWQMAAQGFNSSLSPMLVALIPVFVVILATWMGPRLLKKLLKTAAS